MIALFLFIAHITRDSHTIGTASPLQQLVEQSRAIQMVNTAFTVKNMGYVYYAVVVPPGATNVSVTGHFSASGGTGNDVEVYILNTDQFANFQSRHETTTFYNSGRVTQNSIRAILPPGGATYYLVFNNNFSFLSAKAVQANVTLTYAP
ncbi:MAG: hypothetical protein WAM96_15130 [Candidatus Acidiferrales bacterium]